MPMNPNARVLSTLIGALMTTVAPVSLASAQTIGSVTAVNQTAQGIPPGGGARVLSLGQARLH